MEGKDGEGNIKQEDWTPRPDPTVLTSAQLFREVATLRESMLQLRELVTQLVDGTREVLETRLDGMDKAIELLQATADKFPARIDEKILALQLVQDERFNSIHNQFKERDVRTEQTSKDSKVAVDAALQAAKEAVGEQNKSSALAIAKSETSTDKRIDQMGLLIQTTAKGSDEKIDDIKERLTRIEGKGEGTAKSQASTVAVIAVIVAALGMIVALFVAFTRH